MKKVANEMLTKDIITKMRQNIDKEIRSTENLKDMWVVAYQAELAVDLQSELDRLKAERRWVRVSERLPKEGQTVEIRKTSDYYTAIYRPSENQFIPWELLDESMKRTMLWRRREAVDEWLALPTAPEKAGDNK